MQILFFDNLELRNCDLRLLLEFIALSVCQELDIWEDIAAFLKKCPLQEKIYRLRFYARIEPGKIREG